MCSYSCLGSSLTPPPLPPNLFFFSFKFYTHYVEHGCRFEEFTLKEKKWRREASCGSSNRIYRLCLTFSGCCCVFLTRFCTLFFFFLFWNNYFFNFSLIMSVSIFNKTCISFSLLGIYNYEMILFLVLQYCHPQYIQRLYSFVPCVVFIVTSNCIFIVVALP